MSAMRISFLSGVLLWAVAGCASSVEGSGVTPETKSSNSESITNPAIDARVQQLLGSMTLEQKVAQMIQGEIKHVTPDDVRRYGCLLYTSPSPRDGLLSRMPSSA